MISIGAIEMVEVSVQLKQKETKDMSVGGHEAGVFEYASYLKTRPKIGGAGVH